MSRTVLVTGAGNGIGAATAREFAAGGDDVVVTDIDLSAALNVAQSITEAGGLATAHLLDVSSAESWSAISVELRSSSRAPEVIVNNAFLQSPGAAHDVDEGDWNRALSVTLSAVYRSIHTFHDTLIASGGSVVNVASVHALIARPRQAGYAAAKGGIVSLTRQLSLDYAPAVRVNCVIPGAIQTRAWDSAPAPDLESAVAHIALGRFGRPEEVASVIQFLASEGATYITGAAIVVDGGQSTWTEL